MNDEPDRDGKISHAEFYEHLASGIAATSATRLQLTQTQTAELASVVRDELINHETQIETQILAANARGKTRGLAPLYIGVAVGLGLAIFVGAVFLVLRAR